MSATFADYCKTLTEADMRDLGVHPGCAGTVLEMLVSEGPAVNEGDGGVHVAGWLRDALMLRWMTARVEAAERERDEARALLSRVVNGLSAQASWDGQLSRFVDEAYVAADVYLDAVKPAAGGGS